MQRDTHISTHRPTGLDRSFRSLVGKLFCLAALVLLSQSVVLASATDAGTWELKVCADPENRPISTAAGEGYENLIAEILAEQLGARLTYFWTPINANSIRKNLETGDCDLVMSAGEGIMGLLNTVAYYRIPHMFLYRTESGLQLDSLYDEQLKGMTIGAMPNTAIHSAIFDLDLAQNFRGINPNVSVRGPERIAPTVNALLDGDIDVAIVPGAWASSHVAESGGALAMSPVRPELFPPLTPMFQLATIGVRAHDEGLRDALNRALAERWDDVQQVFVDLGVPTLPSPPIAAGEVPDGVFRVGVVAPFPTSFPKSTDEIADSAYYGARLADDLAARQPGREDLRYEVIFANAPSPEAAVRAADRLVAVNGVGAVVSALETGATLAVAERAAELDVVHLNALAIDEDLRNARCFPRTFHLAPSSGMYARAMADQALARGATRVAVVHTEVASSSTVAEAAATYLTENGVDAWLRLVDEGPVFPYELFDELAGNGEEAVLTYLEPAAQEMFVSEAQREELEAQVIGFPWPVMQTRSFYYRLGQVAPDQMRFPRIAGWEATLTSDGAAEANLRYRSRSGLVMDVTAWATYAAVDAAIGAAALVADAQYPSLSEALSTVGTGPASFKGELAFDPTTNQLEQPLYLVQIDPEQSWTQAVGGRTAIASVVDTLPLQPAAWGPSSAPTGGCD